MARFARCEEFEVAGKFQGIRTQVNPAVPIIVCHITTSHSSSDVRIYERECRSLASSGDYKVILVGPGPIPANSQVEHVVVNRPPSRKWFRLLSGLPRAQGHLRHINADIYHFHDPELIPLALCLATRGKQVIWDSHEDYVVRLKQGGRRPISRWANSLLARATERVLSQVDARLAAIVAATPGIAERYDNPQTIVVGNEARLEDFSAARPQHTNTQLLFTGAPSAMQLLPQIVEAVRTRPLFTLAVARHDVPAHVLAEARSSLGDRFHFLGFLDREQLATQISQSVLGFSTYAPTPAYSDPTVSPTKFFEFAAAGLPVICSPLPSLTRLVAESGAGLVAADYSSTGIGAAIDRATTSEETWAEMSESGRSWASQHGSWIESEARLLNLYRVLAEQ